MDGFSIFLFSAFCLLTVTGADWSKDFNDFLIQSLDGVIDLLGGEDGQCTFVCPDGSEPRGRTSYIPEVNGCGSFGINMDISQFPAMTDCCNEHDICYGTCKKKKQDCDHQFKGCLKVLCKNGEKLGSKFMDVCKRLASVAFGFTNTAGCAPYKEGQRLACYCPYKQGYHTDHDKESQRDRERHRRNKEREEEREYYKSHSEL